uniref:Interleukin 5 receptor subunit alpha n=1 Tax=Terrapene triunguis TaxID=2587831 RepID=A0A674JW78_9SAUR
NLVFIIILAWLVQVLPPVNFTVTVSALAEVLLQWKPNPDQEKNDTVKYEVDIMTPELDPKTCSTCTAVLHNGFSARIRTLLLYNNSQMESNWVTAKLQAPPGAVETSVTNLSCVIYMAINNTASLHCTWLAGKEAPEDTKYFLFYRYNSYTEECQEYSKDKWKRNIGCRFSNTYIKTSEIDEVVVHINGSSKYTAIKPFEQLFNPNAIEKVNPPRNVTVSLKQNNLLVTWEMPTSSFIKDCFEYELNIYNWKTGYNKVTLNSFSLRIDDTCRYSIQIRANHQSWCSEGFWSEWTDSLYIGKNQNQPVAASWWGLGTRVDRQPPITAACSSAVSLPPLPCAAPALCLGAAPQDSCLLCGGEGREGRGVLMSGCPPSPAPAPRLSSIEQGGQTRTQDRGSLQPHLSKLI